MRKIFVCFLVFSCLAKPLSLGVAILEEVGDVYPKKTLNVIGRSTNTFPVLQSIHKKNTLIEERARRSSYQREKHCTFDTAQFFSPKSGTFFVSFSDQPFLFSQTFALYLRSPPAFLKSL